MAHGMPSECLACHQANSVSAVQGFRVPGSAAGTAVTVAGVKRIQDPFKKLRAHHHSVRAARYASGMKHEWRHRGLQTSQVRWWRDTNWHPKE